MSKDKASSPQHLERAVTQGSIELKDEHKGVDAETARYLNSGVVIGEAENQIVLRLLRRRILPCMIATYFAQTWDKGTLAFSAVMGLREDNNLQGQEYALLGTMLYIGVLIGEVPINRLIQILPVAKLLGALVICWGALVMSHAAAHNFSGLLVVRLLLGIFESGVQPLLMVLTAMYFKREEHPEIISYWFSMQGVNLIVAGLTSFGISKIPESAPIQPWQALFILVGSVTIIWGITILIVLPDSPMRAKCWTEEQKTLIIERLRTNELGVQEKTWKREQAIEALTDPLVWSYVLMQISSFLIVNGLAVFSNVIVKGLGFSTSQTLLLNLAQGALTIIINISCGYLARRTGQTVGVMVLYSIPAVAGTIVFMIVPVSKATAVGLLICFYLIQCFLATGTLLWSLVSRNIAGRTKKSVVMMMMFGAYSVGCIAGPQVFNAKKAPRYTEAWISHLVLYGVFFGACGVSRVVLMRRNKQKRQILAAANTAHGEVDPAVISGAAKVEGEVIDHGRSFADLTDKENLSFRYAF